MLRLKLGLGDGVKVIGSIGFKPIRQKSMHFKSSRFRESLMSISLIVEENSITDFVQNLDDMQILFTSMSPATVAFFDNSFNYTRFTRTVRNLDWRLGDGLEAFGTAQSTMSQELAQKILNDSKPTADEESADIQNRQVETKMLSLAWLHAAYKGNESVGFSELVIELANAPNEALFSTELIITLIEHLWPTYARAIFIWGFIPYLTYFLATLTYVIYFAVYGIDVGTEWDLTAEFFLRWVIIVSVFYLMFFEIIAMIRDGFAYFKDPYNLCDWLAFSMSGFIIWDSTYGAYTAEEER